MPEFRNKAHFEGVECIKATDRAILCVVDGTERWVPQSQVDDDSEVFERGDVGELITSQWWAEQEGLA